MMTKEEERNFIKEALENMSKMTGNERFRLGVLARMQAIEILNEIHAVYMNESKEILLKQIRALQEASSKTKDLKELVMVSNAIRDLTERLASPY